MFHNLTTFDLYFRQLKNLHFSGTKFTLKSAFFQNKVYQRFLTYLWEFPEYKSKTTHSYTGGPSLDLPVRVRSLPGAPQLCQGLCGYPTIPS